MRHSMIKGMFAQSNTFTKFLISFFIILFCATLFSTVGLLAMKLMGNGIMSQKIFQFCSAFGTFIAGPLVACYVISNSTRGYLSIKQTNYRYYIIAIICVIAAIPSINFTTMLNEQIKLPESWQFIEEWMKEMEKKNGDLAEQFLAVDNFGGYLFNLIVIALIPAVGEELLFRGLIQKSILNTTGNIHIAIWCAGILFSAIHCQFYGFIPRMLMGALFGYFLYWSKSILVPMACHFLNNGIIITYTYFFPTDPNEKLLIEEIGKEDVLLCIVSILLLAGGCFVMNKIKETPKGIAI